MNCKKPWNVGRVLPVPCGKCIPCRINKRRVWCHRIMLESFKHEQNSFLTLTYDNDHLPKDGSLVPDDVRLWLYRFRWEIRPTPIRYYIVGEYGEENLRPHYHAALFGVGLNCSDVVRKTWGKGHIMLGDLTLDSAAYVAGYCVKKIGDKQNPSLEHLRPEFARMSRRPGIAADSMDDAYAAIRHLEEEGWDAPTALQHGSKKLPLGRYLRSKLRGLMGVTQQTIDKVQNEYADEMFNSIKEAYDPKKPFRSNGDTLAEINKQSRLNLEAREKIKRSKTL